MLCPCVLVGARQAFKLVVAVAESDDWVRLMAEHVRRVDLAASAFAECHAAAAAGAASHTGTGSRALEQLRVRSASVLVALYYVAVHAFFAVVRARAACNVLALCAMRSSSRAEPNPLSSLALLYRCSLLSCCS